MRDEPIPLLSAGQRLGDYQIIRQIGIGGMAEVYAAQDLKLARQVAVKVIYTGRRRSEHQMQRFQREARALMRFTHPHILQIFAFGDSDIGNYIVMPLVDSGSLADRIAAQGKLSMRDTHYILERIASALDYAHNKGVIHRDLKPSNILLTGRDPYLTDFGIAKMDDEVDTKITLDGHIVGTFAYMSPEQMKGDPATRQSDLFSLGIIAFEMLLGRLPLELGRNYEYFNRYINEPLPIAEQVQPEYGSEIAQVLQRATTREASERYPTASEFAEAFHEAAAYLLVQTSPKRPVGLDEKLLNRAHESAAESASVPAASPLASPSAPQLPAPPLPNVPSLHATTEELPLVSPYPTPPDKPAPQEAQAQNGAAASGQVNGQISGHRSSSVENGVSMPSSKSGAIRPSSTGDLGTPLSKAQRRDRRHNPVVDTKSFSRFRDKANPKRFEFPRSMEPELPLEICPACAGMANVAVQVRIGLSPKTRTVMFCSRHGQAYNAISAPFAAACVGLAALMGLSYVLLHSLIGPLLILTGAVLFYTQLAKLHSADRQQARQGIKIRLLAHSIEYIVARTRYADFLNEANP